MKEIKTESVRLREKELKREKYTKRLRKDKMQYIEEINKERDREQEGKTK